MSIGKHERPNRGETNVWLTPQNIIETLGPFDFDPCAAPNPRPWPTARNHFTESDGNGLNIVWKGRVWCNPPYSSEAEMWLHKLAEHGDGIALVFARTETAWFQRAIKHDWLMFFPAGRLTFHRPNGDRAKGNAGAPSVFLAIGDYNKKRLLSCGIPGFFCTPKVYDFV